MDNLFQIYDKFLSLFPDGWHTIVSTIVLLAMIMLVLKYWKVGIIGIVLLVIFVPASVPVLKNIGMSVVDVVKHVINK
jgi:hypothetical protein